MDDGAIAKPVTLRYLLVGGMTHETYLCDWHRGSDRGAGHRPGSRGRTRPVEDVRSRHLRPEDVRSEALRSGHVRSEGAHQAVGPDPGGHVRAEDLRPEDVRPEALRSAGHLRPEALRSDGHLRSEDLRPEDLRTAVCGPGQDELPEDLLPEAGALRRHGRTREGRPGSRRPARPGCPEARG